MVNRFKKKQTRFTFSGQKQYRRPMIFNAPKNEPKKEKDLSPHFYKYIFVVIVFLAIVYLFFFSRYFRVKDVMVEGNKLVKSEDIIGAMKPGTNIFLFNSKDVRQDIIRKNPEIKNVEIYRGIPNAIKLVVLEHDNKMIWQTNNEKHLISVQGVATRKMNEGEVFDYPLIMDTKNIPINIGDRVVSPNFIAFVINIRSQFFDTTNIKPTDFEITETTLDINLKTEAGFYVKLNTLRSSSKQLDNLKKVLVERRPDIHEYVDLRVDGWAYYK